MISCFTVSKTKNFDRQLFIISFAIHISESSAIQISEKMSNQSFVNWIHAFMNEGYSLLITNKADYLSQLKKINWGSLVDYGENYIYINLAFKNKLSIFIGDGDLIKFEDFKRIAIKIF